MSDLVKFLLARIAEDEAAARAASRPYRFADDGSTAPTTGVHWQWVTGDNWEPMRPDPTLMEFVEGADGSWAANLSTIEEWPVSIKIDDNRVDTRMMPLTYAESIVEMDPAAAIHIARHDPARVLAECAAKRAIVELHTGSHECSETDDNCVWIDDGMTCETLRLLAQPYAGADGWDEAWKVET